MILMIKFRIGAALCVLMGGLCNSACADPEAGWWWNPNESGRGFFVESHAGSTFIGAYLYDTDGHASWLVSGGPSSDPYNWMGDLYNKTNGQTLFGSYVAPGNANVIGQLSVHFNDDTHGTLTWPGGQVAIERQVFGTGAPDFLPYTGWWWNPNESGSGYSVEVQGNNLFVVGFMYDDSGRPVWYYSAGPMTDATTYHGDVLQFANGQTIGGPYQAPATPSNIATLDIRFTDATHATFTVTEAAASAARANSGAAGLSKLGRTRSDSIEVQLGVKPSTYIFPTTFKASFSMTAHQQIVVAGTGTYDTYFTLALQNAVFVNDPAHPDYAGRYVFNTAGYTAAYNEAQVVSFGNCVGTQPNPVLANPGQFVLLVAPYVLTADDSQSPAATLFLPDGWSFDGSMDCVLGGQGVPTATVTFMPAYGDLFNGKAASDVIQGQGTRHDSPAGGPVDTQYQFSFQP